MQTPVLALILVSLSLPVSAQRVCDPSCVNPACGEQCVKQDLTVGRGSHDTDMTIDGRRRDPGRKMRTPRRPAVDQSMNAQDPSPQPRH
jgi:hypothetical protein